MAWVYLLIAGLLEVGWALGLKYTDGFTRLLPSVFTVAAMIGSIVLLPLLMLLAIHLAASPPWLLGLGVILLIANAWLLSRIDGWPERGAERGPARAEAASDDRQ